MSNRKLPTNWKQCANTSLNTNLFDSFRFVANVVAGATQISNVYMLHSSPAPVLSSHIQHNQFIIRCKFLWSERAIERFQSVWIHRRYKTMFFFMPLNAINCVKLNWKEKWLFTDFDFVSLVLRKWNLYCIFNIRSWITQKHVSVSNVSCERCAGLPSVRRIFIFIFL